VSAVLKTLRDRERSLIIEINDAKILANRLANNVVKYSDIERNIANAEATYLIMVEQAKAITLSVGKEKPESEIYEYAVKPTSPSSPNKNAIIGIGLGVGILCGIILSLILSYFKGAYHSVEEFLSFQTVRFSAKSKLLRRIYRFSLSKLFFFNNQKNNSGLRELKIEINKIDKKIILISGLGSKLKASAASKFLGIELQSVGVNVAYIDFSRHINKKRIDNKKIFMDNFLLLEKIDNLHILSPRDTKNPINFLTKLESKKEIQDLNNQFDKLILSVNSNDTNSLVRYLNPNDVIHIGLVRKNKTKRKFFEKICKIMPLEVLLYD
jgi:hypothetical protein